VLNKDEAHAKLPKEKSLPSRLAAVMMLQPRRLDIRQPVDKLKLSESGTCRMQQPRETSQRRQMWTALLSGIACGYSLLIGVWLLAS